MRTFVALNLPAAVRQEAHAALDPVRGRGLPFRWMNEPALHLTLRFLGDIEPAHVEPLTDTLRTVASAHDPLTLRAVGLGAFPSLRRANVVWFGIAPDPSLAAVYRALETALFSLGWPRESRPFRPHVTVARLRNGARPPDVSRLAGAVGWSCQFVVPTLDLMRSHTAAEGARYEVLARLEFGARPEY